MKQMHDGLSSLLSSSPQGKRSRGEGVNPTHLHGHWSSLSAIPLILLLGQEKAGRAFVGVLPGFGASVPECCRGNRHSGRRIVHDAEASLALCIAHVVSNEQQFAFNLVLLHDFVDVGMPSGSTYEHAGN
jgi:hypothetical protein